MVQWVVAMVQTARLVTLAEVMQGVFLVLELILPTRNLMFLYLWWQYLKMRFTLDRTGNVCFAFHHIDEQILNLLNYRSVCM